MLQPKGPMLVAEGPLWWTVDGSDTDDILKWVKVSLSTGKRSVTSNMDAFLG